MIKFIEEEFCKIRDRLIRVFNAKSNLTNITFDFHHLIKN